jgi:dynein heavy chain 1
VRTGLSLQCASWHDGALRLNDGETVLLTTARLDWVEEVPPSEGWYRCPAYLNADRTDLLFTVDLPLAGAEREDFVQRGVCLLAHE